MSTEWADIHISSLPQEWGLLVQQNYLAQLEATKTAGDEASEANGTANETKELIEANNQKIEQLSETVEGQESAINQSDANSRSALKKANESIEKSETNAQNLSTHTSSSTQHGATGDIVGNEDFAQAAIGGVVLLASKVDELTQNTVNVANAPAAYDQAHAQSIVEAINSLASKQNDIIGKINEFIQSQQNAKQMQSNS